jgi:hypothetical protein
MRRLWPTGGLSRQNKHFWYSKCFLASVTHVVGCRPVFRPDTGSDRFVNLALQFSVTFVLPIIMTSEHMAHFTPMRSFFPLKYEATESLIGMVVNIHAFCISVDCFWKVMAHAQKPDFVFRRNGRVHLNRRGRQFNRLLAAEVCASAVVMLDTPRSKVVWRVLAIHSIRQFPLHFPSRASPLHFSWTLLGIKLFISYCWHTLSPSPHGYMDRYEAR